MSSSPSLYSSHLSFATLISLSLSLEFSSVFSSSSSLTNKTMTQLYSSTDSWYFLLSLLYDKSFSFVSFFTSNPLHLAYFLFLLPYFFTLISFLFPLILSTFTLLILFLHSRHDEEANAVGLMDQLVSVVVVAIGNVFEWDYEEMWELYKENVDLDYYELGDDPIEIFLDSYETELLKCCPVTEKPMDEFYDHSTKEDPIALSLENFERSGDSNSPCLEKTEQLSLESSTDQSKILEPNSGSGDQSTSEEDDLDLMSSPSLQKDASTRKEKEWKKTLAYKLYEERMTFKLCEDKTMDSLWEAYEADATNADKFEEKNEKKEKDVEEEEEEEEELEEGPVQLCCLQAFRLSTKKINLGARRPNLEKIAKVFRGISFLHRSGRRSKKVDCK